MFVVVYLCGPGEHVIVPQKFIQNLSQQSLNNYGQNRNKIRLVFWSKLAIDAEGIPDKEYQPDFDLNLCSTFPPNNGQDEACYQGQTKYFFGEYEYFRILNIDVSEKKMCCFEHLLLFLFPN